MTGIPENEYCEMEQKSCDDHNPNVVTNPGTMTFNGIKLRKEVIDYISLLYINKKIYLDAIDHATPVGRDFTVEEHTILDYFLVGPNGLRSWKY